MTVSSDAEPETSSPIRRIRLYRHRSSDRYKPAGLGRRMNCLTCYAWDGCKWAVDYYAKTTKYREEFVTFGDDVLEDAWSLWYTRTFNSGGGTGCPSASSLDTISTKPMASDSQKGCGYTVTDKAVIVCWNIPGGFDYV